MLLTRVSQYEMREAGGLACLLACSASSDCCSSKEKTWNPVSVLHHHAMLVLVMKTIRKGKRSCISMFLLEVHIYTLSARPDGWATLSNVGWVCDNCGFCTRLCSGFFTWLDGILKTLLEQYLQFYTMDLFQWGWQMFCLRCPVHLGSCLQHVCAITISLSQISIIDTDIDIDCLYGQRLNTTPVSQLQPIQIRSFIPSFSYLNLTQNKPNQVRSV